MKNSTIAALTVAVIVLGVGGWYAFIYNPQGTPPSSVQSPGAPSGVSSTPTTTSAGASGDGSAGTPSAFTMAQVAAHNSAASCYTAINGSVYDVTNWIYQHPGGSAAILSLCGKDGSAAFNDQHGGQRRPEAELASFKIGTLTQ